MTNKIQIELQTEDSGTGKTLDNISKSLKGAGKSVEMLAKESVKSAGLAEGSFAKLRSELISNRKALDHLEVGSDIFNEQAAVVADLEQKFSDTKAEIVAMTKAGQGIGAIAAEVVVAENSVDGLKQRLKEATAAANAAEFGSEEFKRASEEANQLQDELKSVEKAHKLGENAVKEHKNSLRALERELKDATDEMERMDRESESYRRQKKKVDALSKSMRQLNSDSKMTGVSSGKGAEVVRRFTSEVGGIATSLLGVSSIVTSLQADLEKLDNVQENQRLAQLDFEGAAAAQAPNLQADLPEAKQLAKKIAGEKDGFTAAVNLDIIGDLKSSGARNLDDAGDVLRTTSQVTPFDPAAAAELGKSVIILSNALDSTDFKAVTGMIQAGQSQAVVTNMEDFARANSNNINAAILNLGMTAEEAVETSVKFNRVNPNAAEAATAQRSMFAQVDAFAPKESNELQNGSKIELAPETVQEFLNASTTDRVEIIKSNEDLRKAFEAKLQVTGKDTIKRFLNPGESDQKSFAAVEKAIPSLANAVGVFEQTVKATREAAPFKFSDKNKDRAIDLHRLNQDQSNKLAADAWQRVSAIEDERAGIGQTSLSWVEWAGNGVERLFTPSVSEDERAEDRLRFKASNLGNDGTREFAAAQLEGFEVLSGQVNQKENRQDPAAAQMMQKQVDLLTKIADKVGANPAAPQVVVNVPPARPPAQPAMARPPLAKAIP